MTRRRVARRIEALGTDPRPAGAEMLKGGDGEARIRVGDWRVIYVVRHDTLPGIGAGQRVLGAIALARGALADAETAFTDALGTFVSIDAVFEIARSRLDLARVAFAQGHDDVAATDLREAHRRFTELDVPVYARRATQ